MGSAARPLPLLALALWAQRSLGQPAAAPPLELGQARRADGPVMGLVDGGAEQVLAGMRASPDDARSQSEGCERFLMLSGLASAAMTASELSPLLKADTINTFADAIIRHTGDKEVVYNCMNAIASFGVTFNRPATLALNNGTRIPQALEKILKRYPLDKDVQADFLMMVAGLASFVACEVQPAYVKAGCIDRIFDALENFPSVEDSAVQMSAMQGFSDHTSCPYSAEYIANYGGELAGARRISELLGKALAQGNHFHPDMLHGGNAINIQYEIMTVANGLMTNAGGVREALIKAGFHHNVLDSMRDMPDDRSTQERACSGLGLLVADGPAQNKKEIIEGGGLELIVAAMEKFKKVDHHMFVNMEVSEFVPVMGACTMALGALAEDDLAVQDKLIALGILDTYATADPEVKLADAGRFSISEVEVVLRARAAATGA